MANMDVARQRKVLRIVEENALNTVNLQNQQTVEKPAPAPADRVAYSELPGLRHETKDVLKQLQANISTLEDLGGRLGFMMTEVRSLIRR